jgi:hypothetical protein
MDLVHDDDKEHAMAAWEAAKTQSAASGADTAVPITVTFRCRRKDGSHIWVESHACITSTRAYCCFRCAVWCCMHASIAARC